MIELHSVQQSLRLNHQSAPKINKSPRVPPVNGSDITFPPPSNGCPDLATPPIPTVPLSTDSSCSENILRMRLEEKDDRKRLKILKCGNLNESCPHVTRVPIIYLR